MDQKIKHFDFFFPKNNKQYLTTKTALTIIYQIK